MAITAPLSENLVIYQGSKFRKIIAVKDSSGAVRDLTGYTARMQARTTVSDSSTLFSLTEGSGITIDSANGQIEVLISTTDTAGYSWTQGVYDIELVENSTSEAERLMEGVISVSLEVTR